MGWLKLGPGAGASTRVRGAAAEDMALAHLQRAGLRLLERNYRTPGRGGGEVDLVLREADGTLVFVEVRYRSGTAHGGGAASVDAGKRRRLIHAAQAFLALHPQWQRLPCRFDVVEADGDPQAPRLHWIRDAFRLDG